MLCADKIPGSRHTALLGPIRAPALKGPGIGNSFTAGVGLALPHRGTANFLIDIPCLGHYDGEEWKGWIKPMYEGKLVRLRAFDNGDLMPALRISNDYAVMRSASGGILYPTTVDDQARAMGQQTSYTSGEYQFAIETKEEQRFIGQCGFVGISWKNRRAEIAIMLDRAAHGKGYGTDAVSCLCRFGFEELNLHKIKAVVFSFNQAAVRCYEKCGFVQEGILKDEVFREGRYHDALQMALIRTEE